MANLDSNLRSSTSLKSTVYCVKNQSYLPIPLNSHRQARVTAAQKANKRCNEDIPGQSCSYNPNH